MSVEVEVSSVRKPGEGGGAIFWGLTETGQGYAVLLNYKQLPDPARLRVGQVWYVSGEVERKLASRGDYYPEEEDQLTADSAYMLRPSQRNLHNWMIKCPEAAGVGPLKAYNLDKRFGAALADLIASSDIKALSEILTVSTAEKLCDAFSKEGVAGTITWLDSVCMKPAISKKVMDYYGADCEAMITENPYRLVSFSADWKSVDSFALTRIGIEPDSEYRLCAAVEEALYRRSKSGSTAADAKSLHRMLADQILNDKQLADRALGVATMSGQVVEYEGMLSSAGLWLIEKTVARYLAMLSANNESYAQATLFDGSVSPAHLIELFEKAEGYELTVEQRDAVTTSSESNMSLILGGAGTGKTTVLKCLYSLIEAREPYAHIYQLALSGKAALRMSEATGRQASTIAGFVKNNEPEDVPSGAWFVIDEASMMDVLSFRRIISSIPPGSRLVLVGDPYQLAPVGPGKVLHALAGLEGIPQVELTQVKRQSSESGIPVIALAVRHGSWPVLPVLALDEVHAGEGVCFVEQSQRDALDAVTELYGRFSEHGEVQIIAPRVADCNSLNTSCQGRFNSEGRVVAWHSSDSLADKMHFGTFKEGDPVIWKVNDYDRDLRNGSMGIVSEVYRAQSAEDPLCTIDFDGNLVDVTQADLAEKIGLAYAITVHKSQGSQWERVIMPVLPGGYLLERSMLYTAITRSVKQVVLVGDQGVAREAVKKLAADSRLVNLGKLLERSFANAA